MSEAPPGGGVFLRRELTGSRLVAARAAVAAYATLAVLVYLRWLPTWLREQISAADSAARISGGVFPYRALTLAADGIAILAALAWIGLAVLVFLRRSRDLLGLLLAVGFLSFGVVMGTFTSTGAVIAMGRANPGPPWPATVILMANAVSLPWAYCFPDGRFVPRWSIALAVVWLALWLVPAAGGPFLSQPAETILISSIVASTGASFTYRYWRRSSAVQRQQLKWVILGGLVFVVVYLLLVPTGALLLQGNPSTEAFLWRTIHQAILSLAVIAIPIALGIAIFRQGLLDIDLLINRALTYAAITVILAIVFVAISGASNLVIRAATGQRSDFVLLAAVVPVALAFMPMRARALKIADRFVVDRKVMTLLFIDIVGSTNRAYELGDRDWRELLERFRSTVRRCLKRYGGKEIDTTGDGFFITFAGPDQALRCAHKLIESVRPLGLEIRAGVHIGEVQVDGHHVEGANVHLAARVMSEAGPGEVLVSGAFRDVVAGSEIDLRDRGPRALKGVPGQVQLFAALA